MSAKKKVSSQSSNNLPALKIGSRVRCTDDGVEGRIVWANAISVKIRWDDGEQITWRRDSLADRPIEILDPADEDEPSTANSERTSVEFNVSTETLSEETPSAPTASEGAATGPVPPHAETAASTAEASTTKPVPPLSEATAGQPAAATSATTPEIAAPSKRQRKAPAAPKAKKLSALDAAARVLAEQGKPMNCPELIAAMSAQGYWSSPAGWTPEATLYSALAREIATKGAASRFIKVGRGTFALANAR